SLSEEYKRMIKRIILIPIRLFEYLLNVILINILLVSFIIIKLISFLLTKLAEVTKLHFIQSLSDGIFKIYSNVALKVDSNTGKSIPKLELMEIASKNIVSKRSRVSITIFGLMIGIGSVVFLLSIGYGVQDSITKKIANLDEMRQIDVYPRRGDKLPLNDNSLQNIKAISGVESVFPISSLVSKVNNKNSITDVPTYAVTSQYLNILSANITKGKIFEENQAVTTPSSNVKGVQDDQSKNIDPAKVNEISFSLLPQKWIKVYASPDTTSEVIGFTKRLEDTKTGTSLWGSKYSDKKDSEILSKALNGDSIERWVKSSFELWSNKECITNPKACVDKKFVIQKDKKSIQISKEGYIPANTLISITDKPEVLGTLDLIDLSTPNQTVKEADPLKLPIKATKEAVVNQDFLKIMNIQEADSISKTFEVSFVFFTRTDTRENQKQTTLSDTYKIVGVINDGLPSPSIYVPMSDIKPIGLNSYNNLKVVASSKEIVNTLRKEIETGGYSTTSVLDVIAQIDSVFQTVKVVLLMLGLMALLVSAVGMFNTLTVSLLERTREVGLLKTMGMGKREIRDLFLIESISIGLYGGLSGLIFGFVFGKLVSFVLSALAVVHISDPFELTRIPTELVIFVAIISFVVGMLTGIYPARRAAKISPLSALKYE
ncbi:MAG: FtsX-like permease family protein, partial [bacterium]